MPWKLNGERVSVVENNEHLGIIASGLDEEAKNIDKKITQCRNSLFAFLGPAFSFKCLLSPLVQIHLWRVYNLPVPLKGEQKKIIKFYFVNFWATYESRIKVLHIFQQPY